VGRRIPASLQLLSAGLVTALLIGVPLGAAAAIRRNSAVDHVAVTVALLGQTVPAYWLGLMLIIVFSVRLDLLPASGKGTFAHLILPTITLSSYLMGLVARLTRAGMLEVLGADYIRTARAKGLACPWGVCQDPGQALVGP